MAVTQVDLSGVGFSATVSVYSPYTATETPLLVSADLNMLAGHAIIEWAGYNIIPGEPEIIEHLYNLTAWLDADNNETVQVAIAADDSLHQVGELSIGLSDYGMDCEVTSNPIGADKAGATHAKEWSASDGEIVPENTTITVTATCNAGEVSVADVVAGQEFGALQLNIDMAELTTDGLPAETDLLVLDNLMFNGVPLNCDHLLENIAGDLWVAGEGDTIRFYLAHTGSLTTSWSADVYVPRCSIGCPRVFTIDGTEYSDVHVTAGHVLRYDAEAEAWLPVTHTEQEWQSLEYVSSWGYYSWDADTPPDGAISVQEDAYFYLDLASAREDQLDGFADVEECASVSFEHDGRLILDGWLLNATSREASPYVSNIATVTKRTNVGIYGPGPALSNEDWVASGAISGPNAAGEFTVTGDGSLTLTIPRNYGSRCDAIPEQRFPTGMPGCPDMTFYHRADLWADYDGLPDQQGQPWSEPAEGVYCWRGFPVLKLDWTVPADCTLTITISNVRHTHTDTHVSDSTRQTDYRHATTGETLTYTVPARQGQPIYLWLAMPDELYEPDLEDVYSVSISGFATGDWVLSEPLLTDDPFGAGQNSLKFFEHWAYRDGGFSAVAGSVSLAALMDTTEDNAGHDNSAETRTLRNFDYVVGAASGLDLTAAYSLAAAMARLNNVCDAWSATHSSANEDAATVDGDSVRLKTLSVTDVRPIMRAEAATQWNLDVALRVASWGMVTGVRYDWRVMASTYVRGALHGPAYDVADQDLLRSAAAAPIMRSADGGATWVEVETPTTNAAGYWRSSGLIEVAAYTDGELERYVYAVGSHTGLALYTRELVAAEASYLELWDPWLARALEGTIWRAAENDGIVYVQRADGGYAYLPWAGLTRPFGTTGEHWRPTIACGADGSILVAATYQGDMVIARSRTLGSDWEEVALPHIGDGLQYGGICYLDGDVMVCGWTDNKIVFRASTQTDLSADPLSGESTTLTVVDLPVSEGGTVPRSAVISSGHQVLVAVGDEGTVRMFRCRSFTDGFDEV